MRTLPLAAALVALMVGGGAGASANSGGLPAVPVDPVTRTVTWVEQLTCTTAGDTIEVSVEVEQSTPQEDTVWGRDAEQVACTGDGPVDVTLAVTAQTGRFKVGRAVVTVSSYYCHHEDGELAFCAPGTAGGDVRLVMRQS